MPLVGAIFGATSSGKSDLAYELALKNGLEIISADSRQVYQGMAIGTGLLEKEKLEKVPHHLLQYISPTQGLSVKQYCADVMEILEQNPNTSFLLAGGTPMYIKSLLMEEAAEREAVPEEIKNKVQLKISSNGKEWAFKELGRLDPASLANIHPNDMYRITKRLENYYHTGKSYLEFKAEEKPKKQFENAFFLNLLEDRALLHQKINKRVKKMFQDGWVQEVKNLIKSYKTSQLPAFSALGYGEIARVLESEDTPKNWEREIRLIQSKTKTYAKRQINYFSTRIPGSLALYNPRVRELLNGANWELKKFQKIVSKLLTE